MRYWRFLWITASCLTPLAWNLSTLAEPTPVVQSHVVQSQTLSGKYQFENGSAGLEFRPDKTVIIHNPSGNQLQLTYELTKTNTGQKLKLLSPSAPAKDAAEIDVEIQANRLIFKTGSEQATLHKVRTFSLVKAVPLTGSKAKQAEGRQIIGLMNRAQQVYQAKTKKFTTAAKDLELNGLLEKSSYQYRSVLIEGTGVMNIAVPKENGLRGYVGVVYVSYFKQMKQEIAIATLCETDISLSPLSKFSPPPPQHPTTVEQGISCPVGTHPL